MTNHPAHSETADVSIASQPRAVNGDAAATVKAVRIRRGAVALLLGGPLSLVFHGLWRIGHGPTVVNEHGVVLGLTNDQWSYLSPSWMALVATGVLAVCSLHRDRLSRLAATLTVGGLALSAAAVWAWGLYSAGSLVLYAGVCSLAVAIIRGRLLPVWSGVLLLALVLSFLPVLLAAHAISAATTTAAPFWVEASDVNAAVAALAWAALGVALTRIPPAGPPHNATRNWTVAAGGRQ